MKRVAKEVAIYLFLLLFLSIWMHAKAFLDHPLSHLKALPHSQFGWWHPFAFTFIVYVLILMVRVIIYGIKRMKR